MASVLFIGVCLVVGGLLMAWLSPHSGPTLARIVRTVGIVLVVLGLLLILFPVAQWIYLQMRAAFNI